MSEAAIHRFIDKLRHPRVLPDVRAYTASTATASALHEFFGAVPVPRGPLSINLDLTVACNHACPHCIDEGVLNTGARLPFDDVVASLTTLRTLGLRSVILIGGGEPTVYPEFEQVVRTIATLGLRCGIVSNGSRPGRLVAAAGMLARGDWIRLSLDAASDALFQRIHRPRRPVTLEAICEGARTIKAAKPDVTCGFSFVIIGADVLRFDSRLTVNVHEMAASARLAKEYGFDYISFKPFLVRDAEGKEVLPYRPDDGGADGDPGEGTVAAIRAELDRARRIADDRFRVIPSLNLLAMFDKERLAAARRQPRRCHMQAMRQVLSPMGVFGCPAYRGDARSLIAPRDGYVDPERARRTAAQTRAQVEHFDASCECRNIACMYSATNWWLDAGEHPVAPPSATGADEEPVFL